MPFISDKVSAAIKQCIVRAQLQNDVMLVNLPNDNIKRQLVRNRVYDTECLAEHCIVCPFGRVGDCAKSGIVYQIECLSCHVHYIGETGRSLSIRLKEHLTGKRKGNLMTPLGKHRSEVHSGNDFDVKCVILAHEPEISARKALEAAFIRSRSPTMNNKNECLSVIDDLVPFISLCEF